MQQNNLRELLDQLVQSSQLVPAREYWLVRTNNGSYYDSFLNHGIVALKMPYADGGFITRLRNENLADSAAVTYVKDHFLSIINNPDNANNPVLEELRTPTTLSNRASQLYMFCSKMKSGDIILIPSEGATQISIGIVEGDDMFNDEAIARQYPIARRVRWVNQIPKYRLEPGLYRALGAHQAMANITKYAESLERNFGSCFMIDGVCHYVLTINSAEVSAEQFFGMGQTLLQTLSRLSTMYDLGINVQDINLSMNLNSPGKVDFKSTLAIAFLIMAILTACSDGQLEYEGLTQFPTDIFNSLVELVSQPFREDQEITQMGDSIQNYLNGMDAQSVEKWNENSIRARLGDE